MMNYNGKSIAIERYVELGGVIKHKVRRNRRPRQEWFKNVGHRSKTVQIGFSINEHIELLCPVQCCCIQQSKPQRHGLSYVRTERDAWVYEHSRHCDCVGWKACTLLSLFSWSIFLASLITNKHILSQMVLIKCNLKMRWSSKITRNKSK